MGSFATVGVFKFFFRKCSATRRRHKSRVDSAQRINIEELVMKQKGRTMTTGTILDADDDDDLDELDLLYWKKLESGQLAQNFSKVNPFGEHEVKTGFETEVPWQPYRVTTPRKLGHGLKDQVPSYPVALQTAVVSSTIAVPRAATPEPPSLTTQVPPAFRGQRALTRPPPPPPPPPPTRSANRVLPRYFTECKIPASPPPQHPISVNRVDIKNVGAETKPPTPLFPVALPGKSPPATIPQKKVPPPPPPIPPRKPPAHPPRSPIMPANRNPSKQTVSSRPIGVKLKRNISVKPPTVPRRSSNSISIENGFTADDNTIASEVKLKPLHWDKVVAN